MGWLLGIGALGAIIGVVLLNQGEAEGGGGTPPPGGGGNGGGTPPPGGGNGGGTPPPGGGGVGPILVAENDLEIL